MAASTSGREAGSTASGCADIAGLRDGRIAGGIAGLPFCNPAILPSCNSHRVGFPAPSLIESPVALPWPPVERNSVHVERQRLEESRLETRVRHRLEPRRHAN